jgi:N-acetylglucosaminyl-diphospho-decaprenol L-rhamnosyltransferase
MSAATLVPDLPTKPEAGRAASFDLSEHRDAVNVSVCIVHRDGAQMLRDCLDSLLKRPQGAALEVIVVDNGSADGSADVVAREYPQVALIRNEANRGFARANNQAAARARGRYLFFLNNDTVVPAGAVGRLLAYAEAHPKAGLIGPRLRDGEGNIQVSYRSRPTLATLLHRHTLLRRLGLWRHAYRRHRRDEFDPETTRAVDVLMGAALVARRDRFLAWGGWDEEFVFGGEDLELCARVGRFAEVVYFPEVEITHLGRASTRCHAATAATAIAFGFARYLRRTGTPPLALFAYKLAVTLDAPVQLLSKGLEYAWRRWRRRPDKAEQTRLALLAAWHFLATGLPQFWRA